MMKIISLKLNFSFPFASHYTKCLSYTKSFIFITTNWIIDQYYSTFASEEIGTERSKLAQGYSATI